MLLEKVSGALAFGCTAEIFGLPFLFALYKVRPNGQHNRVCGKYDHTAGEVQHHREETYVSRAELSSPSEIPFKRCAEGSETSAATVGCVQQNQRGELHINATMGEGA